MASHKIGKTSGSDEYMLKRDRNNAASRKCRANRKKRHQDEIKCMQETIRLQQTKIKSLEVHGFTENNALTMSLENADIQNVTYEELVDTSIWQKFANVEKCVEDRIAAANGLAAIMRGRFCPDEDIEAWQSEVTKGLKAALKNGSEIMTTAVQRIITSYENILEEKTIEYMKSEAEV